jgi:hypothetical protein
VSVGPAMRVVQMPFPGLISVSSALGMTMDSGGGKQHKSGP